MPQPIEPIDWLSIIPLGSCREAWTKAWAAAMSMYGLPTVRTLRVEALTSENVVKDELYIILADLDDPMASEGIQEAIRFIS